MRDLQELREEKQCLIILYDKRSGLPESIYGLKDDQHGYPLFLVKPKNQWLWRSAKHYLTREERMNTYYSEFERVHGVLM